MRSLLFIAVWLVVSPLFGENACKPFPELVKEAPQPDWQKKHPTWKNIYTDSERAYVAATDQNENALLFHKASGKTFTVGKVYALATSPDLNSMTFRYSETGKKGTIHVTGLKTGDFKKYEYPHSPPSSSGYGLNISPTGRYASSIVSVYENNTSTYFLEVTDLESGTTKKIKWPDYINSDTIHFLPDGKYILAGSTSKLYFYDLEKGTLTGGPTTFSGSIAYYPALGKTIEINYDGTLHFANLEPGYHYTDERTSMNIPGVTNCNQPRLSARDSKLLLVQCGSELLSINIKDRKVIDRLSVPYGNSSTSIAPNLRYATFMSYSDQMTTFVQMDDEGRFSPPVSLPTPSNYGYYSPTDKGFSGFRMGDSSDPVRLKTVCPISLDPGKCPNCGSDTVGALPLDSIHKKWLEDIELSQMCKLKFDAAAWNKAFPSPAADKISERELMAFLFRFQKKGGFQYDKHLQILVTLLGSPLAVKEPQLMVGMLQNINLELPWLYDYLLSVYPFLSDYSVDPKFANPCRTTDEAKGLESKALEYLDKRIQEAGSARDFTYFEPLKLYTPILSNIPKEKKTKDIEKITEAVRGAAIGNDLLKNVFPSKLYYLAEGAIAPLFGEKHEGIITDLTYERGYNGEVVPILLGPASIGESKRTRFGFHARRLPPLSINKDSTTDQIFKVRWHQNGEKFEGTLKVEHVDLKDLVATGKAPNYDELYRDGKLTGVIMTGSNLRGLSKDLLDQYLQYYLGQGFHFSETKGKIPDMHKFFKEGVEKGDWDYFVKEAHSDGDDKNLFRFDKKSEYLKGTKQNRDGTSEEIYLVFPDANDNETVLLSNQDFGEWVRNRKKEGKGQIVYFNTSCSSSYKAVREVEAARTSHLVDIATGNTALTFSNHSGSAFRAVLDGFRNKKTYEQIRTDMAAIPGYNRSNKDNYLFPDDPQYEDAITKRMMPYGIQIGIKDSNGKDYHIDEVLRSYH